MQAAGCSCDRPQVFVDEPDTCVKCGRRADGPPRLSTSQIAHAIAGVVVQGRRVGRWNSSRDRPR